MLKFITFVSYFMQQQSFYFIHVSPRSNQNLLLSILDALDCVLFSDERMVARVASHNAAQN
jgi:hypothetical protein